MELPWWPQVAERAAAGRDGHAGNHRAAAMPLILAALGLIWLLGWCSLQSDPNHEKTIRQIGDNAAEKVCRDDPNIRGCEKFR